MGTLHSERYLAFEMYHKILYFFCSTFRKWFSETMKELEKLLKRTDSGQCLSIYQTTRIALYDDITEVCILYIVWLFIPVF